MCEFIFNVGDRVRLRGVKGSQCNVGFIISRTMFLSTPLYIIKFGNGMVEGCNESELELADVPECNLGEMSKICLNCEYWNKHERNFTHGECRRNAPINIPGQYLWSTTAFNNWCGEFKQRRKI